MKNTDASVKFRDFQKVLFDRFFADPLKVTSIFKNSIYSSCQDKSIMFAFVTFAIISGSILDKNQQIVPVDFVAFHVAEDLFVFIEKHLN